MALEQVNLLSEGSIGSSLVTFRFDLRCLVAPLGAVLAELPSCGRFASNGEGS